MSRYCARASYVEIIPTIDKCAALRNEPNQQIVTLNKDRDMSRRLDCSSSHPNTHRTHRLYLLSRSIDGRICIVVSNGTASCRLTCSSPCGRTRRACPATSRLGTVRC